MANPKLEFGNPDHIKLAQKGVFCFCGHSQDDHSRGYCTGVKDEDCECECGNWHKSEAECECSEFKINTRLKFNSEKGVFTK